MDTNLGGWRGGVGNTVQPSTPTKQKSLPPSARVGLYSWAGLSQRNQALSLGLPSVSLLKTEGPTQPLLR